MLRSASLTSSDRALLRKPNFNAARGPSSPSFENGLNAQPSYCTTVL